MISDKRAVKNSLTRAGEFGPRQVQSGKLYYDNDGDLNIFFPDETDTRGMPLRYWLYDFGKDVFDEDNRSEYKGNKRYYNYEVVENVELITFISDRVDGLEAFPEYMIFHNLDTGMSSWWSQITVYEDHTYYEAVAKKA